MSKARSPQDFDIHVDPDCLSPAMEETNHPDQLDIPATEELAPSEPDNAASADHTEDHVEGPSVAETESAVDASPVQAPEPEVDLVSTAELDATHDPQSDDTTNEQPSSAALSSDSLDEWIQDGYAGDHIPDTDAKEVPELEGSNAHEQSEEQHFPHDEDNYTDLEQDAGPDASETDYTTDTDTQDDEASSIMESSDLERSHSVRTEALIQAAARAVLAMRDGPGNAQEPHEDADGSTRSLTPTDDMDPDETGHLADNDATTSRPESPASHTLLSPSAMSSVGESADGSHNGAEDDVFSDRSLRSSVHSSNDHYDDDTIEQTTEKGQESPYARSRVASGVSLSDASVVSDLSRLSRYEKEDFIPASRDNRPAFRSPSSVRALQMSSPTPSIITSPTRPAKRQAGFPTISRLGSPTVSGQFSPRGRSTPSRFKKQEAPLVLLHVTLLPLRWGYGDMMNHFEAKKLAPLAFSSEGIKNLRGAWRQLQDRLGDTVLERGILLPHPQNDYEVLEERMLETLELPLRRRARILECGHYLGPSNEMTVSDDVENDSVYSDAEESDASIKEDKRHWCKTCKGDVKYEELGTERVFRIKVYASNGLMSAGAWDACWKEMERVDIEVEPIIDSAIQSDLAKLSAAFDHEKQQQLEAEQAQQAEEEQRFQLEAEQRMSLEEERQQLEAQRQEFEEAQRRSLEESQRKLEEERRKIEEEQRQRFEEERRQQFEEERQLLDAQRQQFEEQRLELEEQRKLVEEEQRQHVEEARRQELELEQKLIEEQRQELEDARQQFEEERRQRLEEEEELRRLQREEDEQKQAAASRSTSRNSYVEDEPASPATERATSTELEPRRRDSDRLREIYGAHGRASSGALSDGLANASSPSIHIHVDSARQREEEQTSRQLAIAAPQASGPLPESTQVSRHPDSYIPPPSPPAPSQQAYERREGQRKSLDSASLPELLGETIRVLFQDPKNVAIAVLVVLIAMLAGQFATRQERGMEIYKPQQHYQHHQLDPREPVGQVIVNTPPAVETVYQTVTAQAVPQKAPVSKEVEIIYQTVTQYPIQETATRLVETVYSTVTASGQAAAPEVASELPPSSADPSVDLLSFDSPKDEASIKPASSPPFIALGLNPFVCPASAAPEPESDEGILKIANSDEEFEGAAQDLDTSTSPDASVDNEDGLNTALASSSRFEKTEMAIVSHSSPHLATTTNATSTSTNTKTVKYNDAVTETVINTATATDLDIDLEVSPSEYDGPRMEYPENGLNGGNAASAICVEPILFMPIATEGICFTAKPSTHNVKVGDL